MTEGKKEGNDQRKCLVCYIFYNTYKIFTILRTKERVEEKKKEARGRKKESMTIESKW
jgi:hypothetical protein